MLYPITDFEVSLLQSQAKLFMGSSYYCRTHSQPWMQQVLPEHPNFVTSSRGPRPGLGAVRAGPTRSAANRVVPTRRAAKVIERKRFVSDVAPRLWSL
jgi:hypothetical protein